MRIVGSRPEERIPRDRTYSHRAVVHNELLHQAINIKMFFVRNSQRTQPTKHKLNEIRVVLGENPQSTVKAVARKWGGKNYLCNRQWGPV
jgi:hypothetical protein